MVEANEAQETEVPEGFYLWRVLAGGDAWFADQFKLYGALRQCRWAHWWSAFAETFLTLVFTLLPIWVPLIAIPMFGNLKIGLADILHDQVRNGELYIIAAALLAPIYYFTFPQSRGGSVSVVRPFPSQQILILIFIGIICVAVLAIAATKVQAATAAIPPRMIDVSVGLFFFCCLVFFLSLAVKNSLPETTEAAYDQQSRREEERFPPPRPASQQDRPLDPDDLVAETVRANVVRDGPDVAA